MGNVFDDAIKATPDTTYQSEDVDAVAEEVSTRTDLSKHVCRELLVNGWRFSQELGKPDRWEKMH